MKNRNALLMTILILSALILGCSFYNPMSDLGNNSNSPTTKDKDLSNKTADKTLEEGKIGIPECDELLDFLAEQTKTRDDNFLTKGVRDYYLDTIRESLKKSIEENKNDPNKLAKECKKLKVRIDKYKAEEETNSNR